MMEEHQDSPKIDLGDIDNKELQADTSEVAWQNYLAAVEAELKEAKAKGDKVSGLIIYAALANHKDRLDKTGKGVSAKMTAMQDAVLAIFEDLEMDRFTAKGRTISTREEVWAGHQDDQKAALMKALQEAGLGEYVNETYNTQSLSAWVREFNERGLTEEEIVAKLPAPVQPFIKISKLTKISSRKA